MSVVSDELGETTDYNYDMANRLLNRDYRTRPNSPGGAVGHSESFVYIDDSTLASEALMTKGAVVGAG